MDPETPADDNTDDTLTEPVAATPATPPAPESNTEASQVVDATAVEEPDPEPAPIEAPTTALADAPLTDAEPVNPVPAFCSECGAPRTEGAKFCSACGHRFDGAAAIAAPAAAADGEEPMPLDRRWLITAAVSGLVLVLLVGIFLARRDPPGPNNKNARAACDEMARVSREIIEGRADSFAGQLDKVLVSARAAAKDDKDYATLSAAVKRLSEDPGITSEKGGKAVETIAEECK